ncbi:solute carrier family 35 member G1 [Anomaloglossus baeobatrachus]|uniref:solute carrier family 35 member G1 n=1 Tax=Anomaloglossus baeobatrachus TaxID=238106 RepID=UPI003F50219F
MGSEDREGAEEEPEIIALETLGRHNPPPENNGSLEEPRWDSDRQQTAAACAEDDTADPERPRDPEDEQRCCPHNTCAGLMVTDEKTGKKKCTCPGLGIFYTVVSALLFSSSALLVKLVEDMHSVQISAIRCVFQMFIVLPGLIYFKLGFLGPKDQRIFLFLRGLLGSSAMIMMYYAVQSMPLADATVIMFSSPAFTSIFACLFLKERCSVWDIVFMVVTLVGVVLVARPPFLFGSNRDDLDGDYSNHMKGTIAAVAGAIGASLTIVVLRKMGKSVHYLLSIWYYAIIGLIESVIAVSALGVWRLPYCGVDRWLLVFIGVLGLGGQAFLVKALQIEKAGPVSVMRTMDVVFAFIFQAIFFHHTPTWLTIGGALLVIAGTAGTAILKWYTTSKKQREEN